MTEEQARELRKGDKVLISLPVDRLNYDYGAHDGAGKLAVRSVMLQFFNVRIEVFPADIIRKVEDDE